jgi:hypothetical protein
VLEISFAAFEFRECVIDHLLALHVQFLVAQPVMMSPFRSQFFLQDVPTALKDSF